MCELCKTRKICGRLNRQIKNIESGGSVSPDAILKLLIDARNDLARYQNAAAVSEMILRGDDFEITGVDISEAIAKSEGSLH